MSYTINPNAKNKWARNAENTMDLSIETDASSVYLDNGRTLEQEIGEGSMVSSVAIVDSAMSKVIDGTLDGAYESCLLKGRTLVNVLGSCKFSLAKTEEGKSVTRYIPLNVLIKPNTKYLYVINVLKNTLTRSDNGSVMKYCETDSSKVSSSTCWGLMNHIYPGFTGVKKHIMTTKPVFEGVCELSDRIEIYGSTDVGGVIEFETFVIEYQEGMENWDIPYFEGMASVKMPIFRNVGKNLFDGSYEQDKYINEHGTISDSADWCATDFIRVRPNTTYTQNKNIPSSIVYFCFYNEDKQLISATQPINYNRTFTTPNNCHFIRTSWKYSIDGFDFQFEEGTETTTYEDHKSNILRTSEEIVLREVKGVQDTYNPLTGEYVKRIGECVLDGSESWSVNNSNNEGFYSASTTTYVGKPKGAIISDKLPTITTTKAEGVMMGVSTGKVMVSFNRDSAGVSNINSFVEKLAQNPITVQYELAEPITTIVEPSTIPFAYQNGHVILESGSEEQSLLPMLEYSTVVNRTGQVESVAKTIQKQEKQLTMLEKMLIQNIINLDYNNTLLTLKNEMEEML